MWMCRWTSFHACEQRQSHIERSSTGSGALADAAFRAVGSLPACCRSVSLGSATDSGREYTSRAYQRLESGDTERRLYPDVRRSRLRGKLLGPRYGWR